MPLTLFSPTLNPRHTIETLYMEQTLNHDLFKYASREILWNIEHTDKMYLIGAIAVAICVYGIFKRTEVWKMGLSADKMNDGFKRLFIMLKEVFLQRKVRQSKFPGILHSLIFYSFLVLLIVTGIIALDYDFNTTIFIGWRYVLFSIGADIAGILILVGICLAVKRRYFNPPTTIQTRFSDIFALLILTLIIISGFFVEAIRLRVTEDPWASISPIGSFLATFLAIDTPESGLALHKTIWWIHALLAFTWLALLPWTKFFHLFTIPLNIYTAKLKPAGELPREDIEALIESSTFDSDNFNIGIGTLGHLTWKQRMNLDACISCGRCEAVCPAVAAKQPLSPKTFIESMRRLQHDASGRNIFQQNSVDIIGQAFDASLIWHCRTCLACTYVCPAFIPHVDTLIEIRRNEVVMKGDLPSHARDALNKMQQFNNPFESQKERVDWVQTLDIPIIQPGESCDVLYWIGCLTTFDPAKRRIAENVISLLKACAVDVKVLGGSELCCGDPARVIGDEYAFQTMAKQQIALLNDIHFNTLLTSCPHCFNVLKNEYTSFGAQFNVEHYTQFLYKQIRIGKLIIKKGLTDRLIYHDPCYLGRYHNIFETPRSLIKAVSQRDLIEMPQNKENSFCCGGGGGHFWMDLKSGHPINSLRIRQAAEKGAQILVTSCPYCMGMLTDGLKMTNLDETLTVIELSDILNANRVTKNE